MRLDDYDRYPTEDYRGAKVVTLVGDDGLYPIIRLDHKPYSRGITFNDVPAAKRHRDHYLDRSCKAHGGRC